MTDHLRWEQRVAVFFGEAARPLTFIIGSVTAGWGTVVLSNAVARAVVSGKISGEAAAIFIGTVLAGVGAIIIGKSFEVANVAKHKAQVETAAINAAPPQNVSMEATPPAGVAITPTPDEGELPESERIK
jgi:hypothetical protein